MKRIYYEHIVNLEKGGREEGRKDKGIKRHSCMHICTCLYFKCKHIYLFLFACLSKIVDVEEYSLILILSASISMTLKRIGRILLILMLYSIIIYILGMF